MSPHIESKQFEKIPQLRITAPAVESLTNVAQAKEVWPEPITQDSGFIEQVETQEKLIAAFEAIDASLPVGTPIEDSVESGLTDEAQLADFYNKMSVYLKSDPAYARLILYFPFEFLPPVSDDLSLELKTAAQAFSESYLDAWEFMLGSHEVRANFVDGDVLEKELREGDHPRVVKAAHLIPELIDRNQITFAESVEILQGSNDPLLRDGVFEAYTVMIDRNMLSQENIDQLKALGDPLIASHIGLLESYTQEKLETEDASKVKTFSEARHILRNKIADIDTYEPEHSTPARTAWLRKDAKNRAVQESASIIAESLSANGEIPQADTLDTPTTVATIEAIRVTCLSEPNQYETRSHWLNTIKTDSPEVSDALRKLYAHLHTANIVDDDTLRDVGVRIPDLAGPFSENLAHLSPSQEKLETMVKDLEIDPFLAERTYPVALALGSQLKGYGVGDADMDVAIFLRPDVLPSEQQNISQRINQVFEHKRIDGSIVMFLLNDNDSTLSITGTTLTSGGTPLPTWAHILLGAAWLGNTEDITHLRHQLLTPYLYDPETQLDGMPTRERWLEEMERDTLQYRLLHKGFERYHPIQSPMNTEHGDVIDGEAAFWDPRYRRIATELYLRKVFLPTINK